MRQLSIITTDRQGGMHPSRWMVEGEEILAPEQLLAEARRMCRRLRGTQVADQDDAIGAGVLAGMTALSEGWQDRNLLSRMWDGAREEVADRGRHVWRTRQMLANTAGDLAVELGRTPTSAEVLERSGISNEVALDAGTASLGGVAVELLADELAEPEPDSELDGRQTWLADARRSLNPADRRLLDVAFGLGGHRQRSDAESATFLGMSLVAFSTAKRRLVDELRAAAGAASSVEASAEMRAAGLGITEIADRLATTPATVSRWLRRAAVPIGTHGEVAA